MRKAAIPLVLVGAYVLVFILRLIQGTLPTWWWGVLVFIVLFIIYRAYKLRTTHLTDKPDVAVFDEQLVEGGLYAIRSPKQKQKIQIVKILRIDKLDPTKEYNNTLGVHLRVYGNIFDSVPRTLDVASLHTNWTKDSFAIMHVPLAIDGFLNLLPEHILTVPVTPEEREPMKQWEADRGGYFNAL